MAQFDEFDSEEGDSGKEFPLDLEVSDDEGEGDEEEATKRKAVKTNGKPSVPVAGTKRKAPTRDPKKGVKRSEYLMCKLHEKKANKL